MLSITSQKLPIPFAPEVIARELENAREYKEKKPVIADYYYERVEAALHELAKYEKIESPSFYEKRHFIRSARTPETVEQKDLQKSIANVHFERGEVFSRLKQWDKANAQYEKAHKWGHQEAQEALRVLAQRPTSPSLPFSPFIGLHKPTSSSSSAISTVSASASCPSTPALDAKETSAFQFFLKNLPLTPPALPLAGQLLRNTEQLTYCLLLLDLHKQEPASVTQLSAEESAWLARVKQDPDARQELDLLVEDIVRAFEKDELKNAAAVVEVATLAPVYTRDNFQKLLNKLITKLDELTLLDFDLLHGLAQMIRHAPPASLRTDDLVKMLGNLADRLKNTHAQSEENQYRLTLAICQLLDAMADNQVTDLDREALHQPLKEFFNGLKQSSDPYLVYQAEYAGQALARVPDDETPWQVVWRRVSGVIEGVSGFVSAAKAFDLNRFVDGIKNLQEPISDLIQFASDTYNKVTALQESGQELIESLKEGFSFERKQIWYSMLRGLDEVPSAQLEEFKQKLIQPDLKACRWHKTFLWGLSERLGQIAAHPEQALDTRKQALQWLGQLYEEDQIWGKHPLIQQRVVQIMRTLADESPVKDEASSLLEQLKTVGDVAQQTFYQQTCLTGPLSPYPLYEARPQPIALSLLDKVQNKQWLETELHRLKVQRLAHWGNPLYVSPRGKASLSDADTDTFDLAKEAKAFFNSNKKMALVLGDSGAGKSTFLRFLESTLWASYRKGSIIPLFIPLSEIDNPEQDFMTKHLRRLDLTHAQIKTLKETREFIVIADGYDESRANENLYKSNRFNEPGAWQGQMIVGCRSQHLDANYWARFQPDNPALFQEWVVAPFGEAEIDQYVRLHVDFKHQHREVSDDRFDLQHWQVSDYQRGLMQIDENFKRTPLLLKIALAVLPRLLSLGEQDQISSLTRVALYDEAMKARFEREKQRLQGEGFTDDLDSAFNALDEHGFVDHCFQFVTELAVAIYEKNQGNLVVEYYPAKDKGTWKDAFFNEAPRTRILRKAWPLIRNGNQYRFEHKSFLEYFATRDICQPQEIDLKAGTTAAVHQPATVRRGSDASFLSFESRPEEEDIKAILLPESLLTRLNLIKEPAMIQFLAERVQTEPSFKQQLHAFVERSKTDATIRKAAANSITILNSAGVSFIDTDLAGIQIPGADLSYGILDAVKLQGADLRKVNLTGIWLRNANLTGARMDGVQFGELPSLELDNQVQACCYSPDGRYLVAAVGSVFEAGNVALYEVETLAHLHTFEGHMEMVADVAFSSDGQTLASASADKTVRLWSVAEKKLLHTFDEHTSSVRSVTFSSDGQMLVSGSTDNTVRLWSVAEKKLLHTFEGHTEGVKSVTFSNDGQTLASGGDDKTVRLWSVEEKKLLHIFEGHIYDVGSVAFSSDGQILASSGGETTVRLWSVADKKLLHIFEGHTERVYSVTFSSDGQTLASSSGDNTVRLWSVAEKKSLCTLEGHTGGVTSVAFSRDGQILASGGWDNVRLWSITSGQCLTEIEGFNGGVMSVTWYTNAKGSWLATGGYDKVVRVWQVHRDGETCHVTLDWASTQTTLTASGVSIQDVRGLSARNTQLLKQRGATGEPHQAFQKKPPRLQTKKGEMPAFTLPAQVDTVIRSRLAYLDLV